VELAAPGGLHYRATSSIMSALLVCGAARRVLGRGGRNSATAIGSVGHRVWRRAPPLPHFDHMFADIELSNPRKSELEPVKARALADTAR